LSLTGVVKEMPNRCQLDLPRSMRAHDVVNVAHLRRLETAEGFGRPVGPPPIFLEGEAVFQPQALKMYKRRRVGGKWQHSYLVKFVGYTDSSNKWLDVDELHLCSDMIRAFWDARGEAPPRGAIPRT
jgi:hypothetical protein